MPQALQRIFAAISSVVLIAGFSLFFSAGEAVDGRASLLEIPAADGKLMVRGTWEGDVSSGTEQPVFSFEADAGAAAFTLRFASFKVASRGYDLKELGNKEHWAAYLVNARGEIDYSKKVGEGIAADFNAEGEGLVKLKFFNESSSGLDAEGKLDLVVVAKPIRLKAERSSFKMEPYPDSWAWAMGTNLGAWTLLENKLGVDSISFL